MILRIFMFLGVGGETMKRWIRIALRAMFIFGFLLCVGSVGTLEFENADGVLANSILIRETIKGSCGMLFMLIPFFAYMAKGEK